MQWFNNGGVDFREHFLHDAGSDALPGRQDHWRGVQGSRRGHGAHVTDLPSHSPHETSGIARRLQAQARSITARPLSKPADMERDLSLAGRHRLQDEGLQLICSPQRVKLLYSTIITSKGRRQQAQSVSAAMLWLGTCTDQHSLPGFHLDRALKDLCTADTHPLSTVCSTSVAVMTA